MEAELSPAFSGLTANYNTEAAHAANPIRLTHVSYSNNNPTE
jgi:hypothetical protein